MNISEQELQIFSRHLILKEFNEKSFNFLQKQKITIIGLGGIGCPAAQYLVSAGRVLAEELSGDFPRLNSILRRVSL